MSPLGHFRPIQLVLPARAWPLHPEGRHEAWAKANPDRIEIGQADIPLKCNRNEPIRFSPHLYRARNLVERSFNKIKQCRRIATRDDKLAASYPAFV
jgi:transposase